MKRYYRIFLFFLLVSATMLANAQERKFFTHTVSKGQTLYSISKMYDTSIEEIIKHNPECAAKLSVGQQLNIPQAVKPVDNGSAAGEVEESAKYHTIKSGETLYRLSKMYNVSTQDICEANPGLSISNFRVGEVVLIPTGSKALLSNAEQQDNTEKITPMQTHKVKRGDNIDKICEMYGVTEEDIQKVNPDVRLWQLKKNTTLNIPAKKRVKEIRIHDKELTNSEAFMQAEEYIDSVEAIRNAAADDSTVRVAVVLPFLLDSYAPSEQGRMIEYYQGLLMAAKDLKEKGHSYEINAFDSGHKEESLDTLFESGALDGMDIIIGALYANHNKELAKYAKEKNIPLIIPFTSKEDEIFRNPMVYIVNSIQSYIIPEVTSRFVETFPNANVVFIEDTEKSNKKDFVTGLIEELDRNGIPHTTLPIVNFSTSETTTSTLTEVLAADKENILVPTSSSAKIIGTLIPTLLQTRILDETHSIPEYKLFGYPEWQIYAKDARDQFYDLDTYFYATFYSHYSLPEDSKFQEEYVRLYNRNIQNIYPRYSMLGYDTGYYFLLAASKFGKDMPSKINELEFTPVQTGFKFERVNNWGGLVNKKIYFIHYTRDYNIEKIDFDK